MTREKGDCRDAVEQVLENRDLRAKHRRKGAAVLCSGRDEVGYLFLKLVTAIFEDLTECSFLRPVYAHHFASHPRIARRVDSGAHY